MFCGNERHASPVKNRLRKLASAALCVPLLLPIALPVAPAHATDADADLMMTRPCQQKEKCVHTWSLTSRLGDILQSFEARLGPRNPKYRLLGVEFTKGGRPRIWYPLLGGKFRDVIIQLTPRARRSHGLAIFQLGHEAFHLMEPGDGVAASFLEEGLASYFAIAYMRSRGMHNGESFLTESSYRSSYEMVKKLAQLHRDFDRRLKRLRRLRGSFSRISSDDIREAFPRAPAQIARELAKRFRATPTPSGNISRP